jgi:hypothetical protein
LSKRYTDQSTIDLWKQSKEKTTKELVETIGEILDESFSDVRIECIFERLKERLNIKSKMPNTNTYAEMISFGTPKDEIIEVKQID